MPAVKRDRSKRIYNLNFRSTDQDEFSDRTSFFVIFQIKWNIFCIVTNISMSKHVNYSSWSSACEDLRSGETRKCSGEVYMRIDKRPDATNGCNARVLRRIHSQMLAVQMKLEARRRNQNEKNEVRTSGWVWGKHRHFSLISFSQMSNQFKHLHVKISRLLILIKT